MQIRRADAQPKYFDTALQCAILFKETIAMDLAWLGPCWLDLT
jgi:hypothetical protein